MNANVFIFTAWDRYEDIPTRGILRSGSFLYAFVATMLEDDDKVERSGIYSRIKLFPCDPELKLLFDEFRDIFRAWRPHFDAGLEPLSTHPLYVNDVYKQLAGKINAHFEQIGSPLLERSGVVRGEAGQLLFEVMDS